MYQFRFSTHHKPDTGGWMPMNNSQKYYLRSSLQSTAGLFSTGAIYQTFLILAGVTTAQVGTLTSVSSIVQLMSRRFVQ